jgi:hypothetical protein
MSSNKDSTTHELPRKREDVTGRSMSGRLGSPDVRSCRLMRVGSDCFGFPLTASIAVNGWGSPRGGRDRTRGRVRAFCPRGARSKATFWSLSVDKRRIGRKGIDRSVFGRSNGRTRRDGDARGSFRSANPLVVRQRSNRTTRDSSFRPAQASIRPSSPLEWRSRKEFSFLLALRVSFCSSDRCSTEDGRAGRRLEFVLFFVDIWVVLELTRDGAELGGETSPSRDARESRLALFDWGERGILSLDSRRLVEREGGRKLGR